MTSLHNVSRFHFPIRKMGTIELREDYRRHVKSSWHTVVRKCQGFSGGCGENHKISVWERAWQVQQVTSGIIIAGFHIVHDARMSPSLLTVGQWGPKPTLLDTGVAFPKCVGNLAFTGYT